MKKRIYFLIIALCIGTAASYVQAANFSPTWISTTALGQTITVNITAEPGETWTVVRKNGHDSWITFSKGTSGTGDGSITITIAENTTASPREGILTFDDSSGRTFTITQAAASTLSLPEGGGYYPYYGGQAPLSVTSNTSWKVSCDETWITNISPTTGNGTVSVSFDMAFNASTADRPFTLKVETTDGSAILKTYTDTQEGYPTAPYIDLSPETYAFTTYSAGWCTFQVVTNLNWRAESDASWLTMFGSELIHDKKFSDEIIEVNVTANTSPDARTGHITVTEVGVATPKKATFTVTQPGDPAAPTFKIDTHPENQSVPAFGTATFSVTATGATSYQWQCDTGDGYGWSDLIDGGFVSGAQTATLTRSNVNTMFNGDLFRCVVSNGTVTLYSNTATLTVVFTYPTGVSLDKSSINLNVGETANLTATINPSDASSTIVRWSSSDWTVVQHDLIGWSDVAVKPVITAVSAGTATITVETFDLYDGHDSHTATCTVTVSGGGGTPPPSVSFPITSLSFDSSGGEQTFTLTANTDWTITCPASWITVTPSSGSSGATITVTVAANTTGAPRSATLTVSGTGVAPQPVSITQSNTEVANEAIALDGAGPVSTWVQNGVLHVSGLTSGATLKVYNILGTLVASPNPSEGGELVIPLPARGIYIVTNGNKAVKVVN